MRRSNSNLTTSYANVVSSKASDATPHPQCKPRFPAISLPSRQVGSKEGRPAISFTGAEVDACAMRFQFSLIAKFTVGRPSIADIQKVLQAAWNIGGCATISAIWDARHILIILDSEEDVRIALPSHVHKIGHAIFWLFRWYPEYSPKNESKFSTVWVRLTVLPLSLYDSSFVEAIVSTFGYFVAVDDKAYVVVQYARACVELDVTVPVPDSVWISLPNNNGYWQTIEVETKMSYCSKCRMHGHTLSSRRKAKKMSVIPANQRSTQVPMKNGTQNDHVSPGVDNQVDAGDSKEKWTEVISKKDRAKRKNKVSKPMVPTELKGKGTAEVFDGEKAQAPKSKHQPVRGVYVVRQPAVMEVNSEVTTLAMVPYVGPSQETNVNTACSGQVADGPLEGSSCALEYNEETGQLFHPAMTDHFNSIQEKVGSCSDRGEAPDLLYVTRRKKMLPTGSKHCLSNRA